MSIMVQIVVYPFLFLFICSIFYAIYKVIWYTCKIFKLRRVIKKLAFEDNVEIKYNRSILLFPFGKKGCFDFIVSTSAKKYFVSVLSFISTRGRWNIEKTRNNYFIEARRYNKIFYRAEYNSGTEPEHARDYRRETSFARVKLYFCETEDPTADKIFLVYPSPKEFTYSEFKLEYIKPGREICGYKIMYLEDFLSLF